MYVLFLFNINLIWSLPQWPESKTLKQLILQHNENMQVEKFKSECSPGVTDVSP